MTTNPNLPGCDEAPATSTPRGSNSALNWAGVGVRGRSGGGTIAHCATRSSTSASTAIGHAVGADDQRVDVDALDVVPAGDLAEGDQDRRQRVAIDGRLAAERTEQALGRQLVDHLVRRDVVERGRAEHDVGDGLGEDAAEAEHHGRPELRIAQHAGDQLAIAPDHRRDEHVDLAVVRRGGGEQLGRRGRRTASASRMFSLTSPRSVLWAMASPLSLTTTGKPSSVAAATASSAVATRRSPATGTPNPASSCFDSDSDRVRDDIARQGTDATPAPKGSTADRVRSDGTTGERRRQCPGEARPTHWAGPTCTSTGRGGNGSGGSGVSRGRRRSCVRRRRDGCATRGGSSPARAA